MVAARLPLMAGLIVAVLAATGRGATTTAPAVKMLDLTLPIPPMQLEAWVAPKCDVPGDVVAAARRLFELGLADPRGGEYRELSINVDNYDSTEAVLVKCHGWVLPDAENRKSQYAVCWNGLVYPVVEVKEKADLKQDVAGLLRKDAAEMAKEEKENASFPITLRLESWNDREEDTVSLLKMEAIRQALLLRLGEGELASKVHHAWRAPTAHITDLDPFEDMATALAWSAFQRAMGARVRGDNHLALASEKSALSMQRWFEAEWKKKKHDEFDRSPYAYLSVLPQFIADEERRLATPPKPVLEASAKTIPDKKHRIAALIDQLDGIDTTSGGGGGELALDSVPVVRALIDCGDDAVEPLLDVLENDNRLMRSIHFYELEGNPPKYTPAGVAEAAYVALSGILNTSFYVNRGYDDDLTGQSPEVRKQVGETIRTYWFGYRKLSPVERSFKMLADDSRPDRWQQAMDNILRPADERYIPSAGDYFTRQNPLHRNPGETPKLTGESLRSHRNPSVSELLARHVDQFDQVTPHQDFNYRVPNITHANDLAFRLNQWDSASAQPVLSKQLDLCIAVATDDTFPGSTHELAAQISALAQTLHALGDPSALQRYANWVPHYPPDDAIENMQAIAQPLWRYAENPVIAATAESMFNDPKSKWNPILTPLTFSQSWHEELVCSRLLELASFRRQVLRCLNSTTPVAYLKIDKKNRVEYEDAGHNYINNPNFENVPDNDPQAAGPGTQTIRDCDRYAKMLSYVHGAPAMEYHWPQPTRDIAIRQMRDFLTRYGPCIRFDDRFSRDENLDVYSFDAAQVIFPPIGHPASAADVDGKRAIFSLEGRGERRCVTLPVIPTPAIWTTLKKYPQDRWNRPKFQQKCQIWQAEEVNVGGKWERYFGVVGPHEITMMPASKLELDNDHSWTVLANGVNVHLSLPDSTLNGMELPSLAANAPVTVQLLVCNRFGVAHAQPARIISALSTGTLGLRRGVTLSVAHIPPDIDGKPSDTADTLIPLKLTAPLNEEEMKETRLVEGFTALESTSFNLRDYCDLHEPGIYRLRLQFTKECDLGEALQLATFVIRPASQ